MFSDHLDSLGAEIIASVDLRLTVAWLLSIDVDMCSAKFLGTAQLTNCPAAQRLMLSACYH